MATGSGRSGSAMARSNLSSWWLAGSRVYPVPSPSNLAMPLSTWTLSAGLPVHTFGRRHERMRAPALPLDDAHLHSAPHHADSSARRASTSNRNRPRPVFSIRMGASRSSSRRFNKISRLSRLSRNSGQLERRIEPHFLVRELVPAVRRVLAEQRPEDAARDPLDQVLTVEEGAAVDCEEADAVVAADSARGHGMRTRALRRPPPPAPGPSRSRSRSRQGWRRRSAALRRPG